MSPVDPTEGDTVSTVESVFFGAVVVLFFAWRFARTHQLYRFSLSVLQGEGEDMPFKPTLSIDFVRRALFGRRGIAPRSFLIRALVFVVVAVILFPFRGYGPELYFVVIMLILLYLPWCAAHWYLLRRASRQASTQR